MLAKLICRLLGLRSAYVLTQDARGRWSAYGPQGQTHGWWSAASAVYALEDGVHHEK